MGEVYVIVLFTHTLRPLTGPIVQGIELQFSKLSIMVRVHVGLQTTFIMQQNIIRTNKSKKRAILYIDDLSPANRLKFDTGKLGFYDLDIRMFRGGRHNLERRFIPKGYSIVFIHKKKTRLLLFNRST